MLRENNNPHNWRGCYESPTPRAARWSGFFGAIAAEISSHMEVEHRLPRRFL
jgi:hypothetical protein